MSEEKYPEPMITEKGMRELRKGFSDNLARADAATQQALRDDGGPAFPFACQGSTTAPEFYYGMTLRDYFAAKAMAATIQQWTFCSTEGRRQCAQSCYEIADAMLAERQKKGGAS